MRDERPLDSRFLAMLIYTTGLAYATYNGSIWAKEKISARVAVSEASY